MPSASVTTATAVKSGLLASIRIAYRTSCRSIPMGSSASSVSGDGGVVGGRTPGRTGWVQYGRLDLPRIRQPHDWPWSNTDAHGSLRAQFRVPRPWAAGSWNADGTDPRSSASIRGRSSSGAPLQKREPLGGVGGERVDDAGDAARDRDGARGERDEGLDLVR